MEKVRDIRLSGKLGAKFGRMHRYVVSSPRDALRALISMVPGFERELMTSKDRGVRYAVFLGSRNLAENELAFPCGKDLIRIVPVITGRKSGLFTTIAGVALLAVGAVSTFFGNPYGAQMALMGGALAFGGISQMLSAHPTSSNGSANAPSSYYFSGAQNVTTQGGPVPLLYGRMRVGSTVISSGIQASDS